MSEWLALVLILAVWAVAMALILLFGPRYDQRAERWWVYRNNRWHG